MRFVERWLTKHAPMAAIFPGLRKYTLSGACGPDGHSDAFAELWFDDREACQAAYSSDVGRSGFGRRQQLHVPPGPGRFSTKNG